MLALAVALRERLTRLQVLNLKLLRLLDQGEIILQLFFLPRLEPGDFASQSLEGAEDENTKIVRYEPSKRNS